MTTQNASIVLEALKKEARGVFNDFQDDVHAIRDQRAIRIKELANSIPDKSTFSWRSLGPEGDQQYAEYFEQSDLIDQYIQNTISSVDQNIAGANNFWQRLNGATTQVEQKQIIDNLRDNLSDIKDVVKSNVGTITGTADISTDVPFDQIAYANAVSDATAKAFGNVNVQPTPPQNQNTTNNPPAGGSTGNAGANANNTTAPVIPNVSVFTTVQDALAALQGQINGMPTSGGADADADKALVQAKKDAQEAYNAFRGQYSQQIDQIEAKRDSLSDPEQRKTATATLESTKANLIKQIADVVNADSISKSAIETLAEGGWASPRSGVLDTLRYTFNSAQLNPNRPTPIPRTFEESVDNLLTEDGADGAYASLGTLKRLGAMAWQTGKDVGGEAMENREGWGGFVAAIGAALLAGKLTYSVANSMLPEGYIGGAIKLALVVTAAFAAYGAVKGYMQGGGANSPDNMIALKTQNTFDSAIDVAVSTNPAANALHGNDNNVDVDLANRVRGRDALELDNIPSHSLA